MPELFDAVPLWGLVFARVAGIALLVPPIGLQHVPITIRIAAAGIISVPLYYTAGSLEAAVPGLGTYTLWVAKNLAVGLIIGGAVALVLWAAVMAGTYLERLAGWSSPTPQAGIAGSLLYLLCAVLFVLIDGHHAVFRVVAASFESVPPGPGSLAALAERALLLLPARMFLVSLMIAAPALLAALLAMTLLAAAERVSLELAASGISRITAPLLVTVALIAALPAVAYVALWQLQVMLNQVAALLG